MVVFRADSQAAKRIGSWAIWLQYVTMFYPCVVKSCLKFTFRLELTMRAWFDMLEFRSGIGSLESPLREGARSLFTACKELLLRASCSRSLASECTRDDFISH